MTEVAVWLEEMGLGRYVSLFDEHDIALDVLPDFSLAELRDLGISIGGAKRILRAIAPPGVNVSTSEAERRQLTVVFCDLVGSSGLSERLDPEDLRSLLDAYYRCCDAAARQFGGHVGKVVGDGVDLYFGYPQVLEESARSAVEAALELVRLLAEMNQARQADVPELQVRIGVHSGIAVVGAVGGAEHEIVGELPVIAARIQTVASPGSVLLSEATAQLVSRSLHVEDLGPHQLKGLSTAVRLFRAVGVIDQGDHPSTESSESNTVIGREPEMASLAARWALACAGSGQVVVLSGEAGIGKSKIADALASSSMGSPRTLRFQCSPYREGTALWPVIEQIRRAAGVGLGDPDDVKLDRLERLLNADYGNGESVASRPPDLIAVFALLLSIEVRDAYPKLTSTSEQRRQRTLDVIVTHLEQVCSAQPVLVIVEDVQWADPTLLELIGIMIKRSVSWRVMIVVTARSGTALPWPPIPHMATLELGRLADRHVKAIVERMALGKSLPDTVIERILMRTDGVPLFAEELTRTVLDSHMLVDEGTGYALADALLDVAVPATLHDSLATRLDRLGPDREIAQIAAVIGREFSLVLLAETCGRSQASTLASLEVLENSGLVSRRDADTTEWFMFKHALVQNAAYESLLRSTRRELHGRIAAALARQDETREQQPELLARHLDLAGLVDAAVDAYRRAGERATVGSNHEEALAHYRRTLELLATLPASRARAQRELDVHTALRNALVVLKGYSSPEVEQACLVARVLCDELGDGEQLFEVLWNLAGFHMVRADHEACIEINDRLLKIAANTDRADLALMAHDTVGQTFYYLGRFDDAVAQFDRAVELYEPARHRGVAARFAEEDPCAASLAYGAIALWSLGSRTKGRLWMQRAAALADSLPYLVTQALVTFRSIRLAFLRGDHDAARSSEAMLVRLAGEHGFGYVVPSAQVQLGWLRTLGGTHDEGLELMRTGFAGLERVGALAEQPFNTAMLADGYLRAGRPSDAHSLVDNLLTSRRPQQLAYLESELLRLRGEALATLGAPPENVERDLRAAFDATTGRGVRSLQLRTAISLARFERSRGTVEPGDYLVASLAAIDEDLDQPDVIEARQLIG